MLMEPDEKIIKLAPLNIRLRGENPVTAKTAMKNDTVHVKDPDTGAVWEFTPDELEAVRAYVSDKRTPEFKAVPGTNNVYPDHANKAAGQALVARALGITDNAFYAGAVKQLVNASAEGGQVDVDGLNFAVSLVRSIAPQDQLEAMLAIQMASVHLTSMKHMRMLNHINTIPQLDIQERVVNKLMRTFTTQMEALRKHRNGGSQKVTVEHVHVHAGGQAIVGNVTPGGRARGKNS